MTAVLDVLGLTGDALGLVLGPQTVLSPLAGLHCSVHCAPGVLQGSSLHWPLQGGGNQRPLGTVHFKAELSVQWEDQPLVHEGSLSEIKKKNISESAQFQSEDMGGLILCNDQ